MSFPSIDQAASVGPPLVSDSITGVPELIWSLDKEISRGGRAAGARGAGAALPELLVLSSKTLQPRFLRGEEKGQGSWVEYARNGRVAKVSRPRRVGRVAGGVRAAVTEFSRGSRRALLSRLNAVDTFLAPAEQWAFVTLTYHTRDITPRYCKARDLKMFADRFRKAYASCSFIWKLEPQKRGTPHLHLLMHIPEGIDHEQVREFIMNAWHEIADPDSPEHLRWMQFRGWTESSQRREFFQSLRSWSQVAGYAGKYLCKPVSKDWAFPGRYWGVFNRSGLPRNIVISPVSEAAAVWIQRQMARYLAHIPTGRVDVVCEGRRLTLQRDLLKVPGFKDGQRKFVQDRGGRIMEYRYKPSRVGRIRQGFVPDQVMSRLLTEAMKRFPLEQEERSRIGAEEADIFAKPYMAAEEARQNLRRSMPRIAAHMARGKRPAFWQESFHQRAVQLPRDDQPISNQELVCWMMSRSPGADHADTR